MKLDHSRHLRIWEMALMLALCIALCAGAWAQNRQARLADKLIRLHVVAVSDDETEQNIKLQVRDAVLEYLEPLLREKDSAAGAAEVISGHMDGLKRAAESASRGRRVTVSLEEESFPTREYETFSLPAGKYMSLRVVLGDGMGHNWWCVVFPPLCAGGALDTDVQAAALSGDDIALITEDGDGYVLKFRILELWGELVEKLGRNG